MKRRAVLKSIVSLSLASLMQGNGYAMLTDADLHQPLPPRADGELDIHHIDTGRGNCALIVGPDGTAMMIDAGAAEGLGSRPPASRVPTVRAAPASGWDDMPPGTFLPESSTIWLSRMSTQTT